MGKLWVIIDRQMGPNNRPKAIVDKRLDMVLIKKIHSNMKSHINQKKKKNQEKNIDN